MRDLKIVVATLLAVYLYQNTTPSTWVGVGHKIKKVYSVIVQ